MPAVCEPYRCPADPGGRELPITEGGASCDVMDGRILDVGAGFIWRDARLTIDI